MEKVAVVFWSGTGNTETMANAVAKGIQENGAEAVCIASSDFSEANVAEYSAYAFGCPSMGAEQLEDGEFEPMWDSVKGHLGTKKVVLFGSYGWGDGEWMRNWQDDSPTPITGTYICNDSPDEEALKACEDLGKSLL